MKSALEQVRIEHLERREATDIVVHGAEPGVYVQFESQPGVSFKPESLEDRRQKIELVTVQKFEQEGQPPVELATVFVPEGNLKHFVARFQKYAREKTKKGEPRYKDLVDRIAALRRATLRALWTDTADVYPGENEVIWWEVWLRRHDGRELDRLIEFSHQARLTLAERRLAFVDRLVVLVRGTAAQLSLSLDTLDDLAEVRRAKDSAGFFVDLSSNQQAEWIDDLKSRIILPSSTAPAVCVLDSGVTRAHPLLADLIAPDKAMAADPTWGGHDDGGGPGRMGHGTEMAGLAAYGDLTTALVGQSPFLIQHRIESVKILPPHGNNEPDLYGAITALAVSQPEVVDPHRSRVFSLAVTTTDSRDKGQPTSWSAAIDALAAGRSFDAQTQGLIYLDHAEDEARRLFVLSAGNVVSHEISHLDRSDLESVHDPAQAWNALTVGAFTEKATISDPRYNSWQPVAAPGDLSPWSTTSVLFQETWPIKPDVVFEGGNLGHNGTEFENAIPDLCLLSTYYRPAEKPLVLSFATSAATAQVARMAAIIQAEYPAFWPETIRALVVHSAEWTAKMSEYFRVASGKRARSILARRYGFGVPSLERARRSADDSLTLVVQSAISPFSEGKMKDMHLHELPWPKETLQELGQMPVRLRVTLSYFIEPNPGRRGWKTRHRYASHGLRFEVKSPTESVADFRKRLNQKALDEDEEKPRIESNADGWFLGELARSKGSIHSDVWTGIAADLADRGVIGIYPVSGWWKDQPKRDRSSFGARYALIIGIETQTEQVDIWTPVAQQIGVPVEVFAE